AADYYALYGVLESTRFSPVPSDNGKDKEITAGEIEHLNSYMGKLMTSKWELAKNSDSNTDPVQETTIDLKKEACTVIGDFRGKDLDGSKSDGHAFGKRTTLGDPILDQASGKLLGLQQGKASSKLVGMGIFGALRSPNIILEK